MACILRDYIYPRPVVVRLGVVDRLRRPLGKMPWRTFEKIFETPARAAAAHEIGQKVPVSIVPRGPAGVAQRTRDVAAEAPRLGDEHDVGLRLFQRCLDLAQ